MAYSAKQKPSFPKSRRRMGDTRRDSHEFVQAAVTLIRAIGFSEPHSLKIQVLQSQVTPVDPPPVPASLRPHRRELQR